MSPSVTPQEFQANWKPKFFTIFTGQAVSLFGSSLVQFALVWYLTRQTGSATVLATATLIAMLPQVFIGPFAGALIDRWNRRLVMIFADGLIALATLFLAGLFWAGAAQIWHIYLILLIRSLGGAFHWPAMSASTSLMVPKEQLSRVAGANQTLQGLLGIVAPPTGALLIGVLPTEGVLLIDVFTALTAILPLFFIAIPQPIQAVSAAGSENSYWQDLRDGLRYVAAWPGLLAVGAMAVLINFLLTPTGSLMPLLVTRYFGLGALELGFTDTLWGVGMIAGGLLLSLWGGFKRRIATSLTGILGIGLGVILVGLAPADKFWLALAGMSLTGLASVFANGPLNAIIQAVVKPEMQGRVMSLMGSVATAMTPLSLAVAGPLSDAIGIRTWYIIGGALSLLIGLIGFFIPAVMNLETNHGENTPAAEPLTVA
ncbi:MAG: MFS transporter [Anaerolineales bacterium]